MSNLPHTLDAAAVAALLYKTVETVERDVTRDKEHKRLPPHFKIGKKPLWLTQVVLAWMEGKSSEPVTIKIEFAPDQLKPAPTTFIPSIRPLAEELMASTPSKPHKIPASDYLIDALDLSHDAFSVWIANQGGIIRPIRPNQDYNGTIVQTDGLHAVQSLGQKFFAIHQTRNLEKSPVEGNSLIIRYDGELRGSVKFKSLKTNNFERGGR